MAYLTYEEWSAKLDQYLIDVNKNAGKITSPCVGLYPCLGPDGMTEPTPYHTIGEMSINNKMATADLIRHYADALGDTNPLWRSEEYAKLTKYGSIIAPPHFIDCIAPTYGAVGDLGKIFYIEGMVPLNGGAKITWYKNIYPGDTFSVQDQFGKVIEKPKKDPRTEGRLFICLAKRTYYNQYHEVVAVSECTIITPTKYPYDKQDGEAKKAEFKPYVYSPEEMAEIEEGYKNEYRRGSETLFWEDVQEGEELPVVYKGPLTEMDSIAFFACVGYFNAYKTRYLQIEKDPGLRCVDPVTNVVDTSSLIHVSNRVAQAMNAPAAIAFAAQSEGNIVHMICNWMGDNGFLKELSCQSRRMNLMGDMNKIGGKVVRKYVENGEHLVELEVWAMNQNGVVHMPGKAIVRLETKGL